MPEIFLYMVTGNRVCPRLYVFGSGESSKVNRQGNLLEQPRNGKVPVTLPARAQSTRMAARLFGWMPKHASAIFRGKVAL
jgi:hypothetical protein